jgi:subtilisin-like proprotein convertase family protein
MKPYQRTLLVLAITAVTVSLMFVSFSSAQHGRSEKKPTPRKKDRTNRSGAGAITNPQGLRQKVNVIPVDEVSEVYSAKAVSFIETPAVRDLKEPKLTKAQKEQLLRKREDAEKNERNAYRVKPEVDRSITSPFTDPTLKADELARSARASSRFAPSAVTNPLANFDGSDMDAGAVLLGGRFAPPDTNAAVGPNHVVLTTNAGFQVYTKAGVALTPLTRISTLLAGIPNASDDDGDPVVLYDALADRWLISQFNLQVTNNSTHEHIAISKTPDPTGAYFAYDFLLAPNRPGDYPHLGVWADGYYMSTNDFSLPVFSNPFQGAGLYAMERAKMLAGDPSAKLIGFSTSNLHGGMLPTNLQGITAPPAGTPNLFMEFDADEFGAATDLVRAFAFHADFAIPANSTLTQGPDIPTVPFDARSPATRATIAQPAPGEGLDAIADRLMHALNFRVLPGGVQSYVLNFTVNVSGVNPTNAATYQGGVRWMEMRRDPGTGVLSINQQATYAPGSGNPTGRDLWMAGVSQDGEGNIGLAANASNSTATPALQNPTAIYTGRLAGDPANTLPQGEVDAMSAVTKGVQTATSNRWGDYSSLFVDSSDDCTFWGAFEYTDSPSGSFDWDTRIFSFKVNPNCVTSPRGTLLVTVTDCNSGLPVPNASITIDGNPQGATVANGTYNGTLPPGNYTYSITKSTYSTVTGNFTITNGNNTAVNVCIVGTPVMQSAGSTLTNESCPPANGAIDPGETASVELKLTNVGSASTSNLVATLVPSANVLSPSGPQNYGAIAPGGTVGRNFTFTASGNCGANIQLTLQLQDGATNMGTATYTVGTGSVGAPVVTSYSGPAVAIPDGNAAGVNIPIAVSGITGNVGDINFRVDGSSCNSTIGGITNGINHTWVGDVIIKLTSPGGTTVTLVDRIGVPASTFGNSGNNFCQAVLDDQGGFPAIENFAGQPVSGNFSPNNPLSAFNGQNPNGTWTLNVSDVATGDTGSVRAFSLVISPLVCNGACQGSPLINTSTVLSCSAGNTVATITVTNGGTATANNVMLTTAKLGVVNGTPLPQSLGNLAPGASAVTSVTFAGAPSGLTNLQVGGTYTGGTFNSSRRVSAPNCSVAQLSPSNIFNPSLSAWLTAMALSRY